MVEKRHLPPPSPAFTLSLFVDFNLSPPLCTSENKSTGREEGEEVSLCWLELL
jgi:hypothetical protein